jgi:hypothetical protein
VIGGLDFSRKSDNTRWRDWKMTENSHPQANNHKPTPRISEDWLAVIIAFILILFSAIGILGENGLKILY